MRDSIKLVMIETRKGKATGETEKNRETLELLRQSEFHFETETR